MTSSTPIGAIALPFLPPTVGDAGLIAAAAVAMAAGGGLLRIYVLAARGDAIPAVERAAWLRESVRETPGVEIRVVPAATRIAAILAHGAPDTLFARPSAGADAAALGCRLVTVGDAEEVPASAILADPMRHWDHILPAARPRLVRRITVTGPRGTGRSTVAAALALAFETALAAPTPLAGDPVVAAQQHDAAARAAAARAQRLLPIDDGWFGAAVEAAALAEGAIGVRHAAPSSEEPPPALILILDEDLPGCPGAVDGDRPAGTEQYVAAAEAAGLPHLVLRGSMAERIDAAVEAAHGLVSLRATDVAYGRAA